MKTFTFLIALSFLCSNAFIAQDNVFRRMNGQSVEIRKNMIKPLYDSTQFTYIGFINGHHYFLSKIQKNWHEAKTACENAGGHLATVSSTEEDRFLQTVVNQMDYWVWIGFSDEQKEGVWQWVTGESVTYLNWFPGQPDNGGCCSPIEHYAHYWPDEGNTYGWNDWHSAAETYYFMEIDKYDSVSIEHNINFGDIDIGSNLQEVVWIKNPTGDLIYMDTIFIWGEGVSVTGVSGVIPPGDSISATIHYTPNRCGNKNAYAIITFHGNNIVYNIHLTANVNNHFRSSSDSIAFGEVHELGYQYEENIIFYNDGVGPLTLDTMYVDHPDITVELESDTLLAGDSSVLKINYRPTTYGHVNGTLRFSYNDNCVEGEITISGTMVHDPYLEGTWTRVGLEGRSIKKISIDNNTILAVTNDSGSVYISTDMGMNWLNIFQAGVSNIVVSSTGNVFLQVADSLFYSGDNGISWGSNYCPGNLLGVSSIGTIFAGETYCSRWCWSYINRSTDNGTSWNQTDWIPSEFISFEDGRIITSGFNGIGISSDDGLSWTNIGSLPASESGPTALAVTPHGTIIVGMDDGLYSSGDQCVTWTKISEISSNNVLPLSDDVIIISANNQGNYISTDGGNIWLTFNTGLIDLNIHTLAMDPSGYAYAGTDSGLFKTLKRFPGYLSQSGWNLSSFPYSDASILKDDIYYHATSSAFYYQDSYVPNDTLYHGKGYWIKCNGGDTVKTFPGYTSQDTIDVQAGWNIIGSICEAVTASSIQCEPSGIVTSQFFGYNGNTYYETNTISPWKGYWIKVNQPGKLILSTGDKAIASNRIIIVAGNEQPPSPPNSEIPNPKSQIPTRFALEQNYPNPFNPVTTIRYQLPMDNHVTIKIYNVLGEEIATVVDGFETAGDKTVTYDGSALSSGIYFVRMHSGIYSDVKKIVLMK